MKRLELERRKRGWSQLQLAFFASVANTDISRFERGYGRPYPAQAARIATVLGLQPHELLAEVDDAG